MIYENHLSHEGNSLIHGLRGVLVLMMFIAIAGCRDGANSPLVAGGTMGKIHNGRDPLIGIQVTVHQVDGEMMEPIGVAASRPDGSFELVTLDGTNACQLTPGEYRCTLESAGTPLVIPKEFTSPETTPLKINLAADDEAIDLKIPQLKNEH